MLTIWKYSFSLDDARTLMPAGAVPIHIESSSPGTWLLWALVDTEERYITREFIVYGTGYDIPKSFKNKYIETFIDLKGFVWHVFDLGESYSE